MKTLTEKAIQNALWRDIVSACQMVCPNYTMPNWWEADLLAITKSGYVVEYEIKLTKADFKADEKKASDWGLPCDGRRHPTRLPRGQERSKHAELAARMPHGPNRFYYVVPYELRNEVEIPEWAGALIVAPGRGRIVFYRDKKFAGAISAPLLHKEKKPELLEKMGATFYWRYWTLRERTLKGGSEGGHD